MRDRRTLQIIVVFALWGLITHGTFAGSGDEPHYLAIAHSIAFDRDLDLSNNYGTAEPLIAGGHLEPGAHVRPGVGGVARPVHDVGLPLVAAPFVRAAVPIASLLARTIPPAAMQRARLNRGLLYRHLLSLAMIALAAILAGLMFDSLGAIGAPPRAAFATTLLLMLSPPLMIFSILLFTELISALIGFVVFRRVAMVETVGVRPWAAIGFALGLLFLIHAKNIGLTIPLAALSAYELRAPSRRRELMAFALGLAIALAARTWINYLFWGTLLEGPHARFAWTGVDDMIREFVVRLTALIADQEFGLLPYAPIYIFAIAGAFTLARSQPALTLKVALICVCSVGLIVCPLTNVHGWMGGWTPPARFLTPIVPLLVFFVYSGMMAAPRLVVAAMVAVQIVISAYVWQHPKVLWNDGDGTAAFCETTAARACAWLPSFAKE